MINFQNNVTNCSPINNSSQVNMNTTSPYFKKKKQQTDTFETNNTKNIGYWRAAFSRLTNEQIKEANETGKVNGCVKIVPHAAGTGYRVTSNLFKITTGTQTIPEGYELRKNWLGFTCVLPKDSEGLFIKKK